MFKNIQQTMQLMQAMQHPQQFLQKMGIPQENLSSPQEAAKYLMQTGRVTQQQIDQASSMYQQFMNGNAQR